ncbi:hypothetical protein [Bremerella cremea]|uniref:hypothetical protein n=1 Tax=Bremerella cremea TaxID=1031537 RepID=UPI0031EE4583
MTIAEEVLTLFPPSEHGLIEWLCPQMSDAMLQEIAMADNGFGQAEMFVLLKQLRSTGTFAKPMDVDLREVLSLTCWVDPDRPNPPPFPPGPTSEEGHRIRLFACAVRLQDEEDPCDAYDTCLAIALESAAVVGSEADRHLGRYLTWRIPSEAAPRFRVLCRLGLLILLLRSHSMATDPAMLESLADQIMDEEHLGRRQWRYCPTDPEPSDYSVTHGFWKKTIAAFRQQASMVESADLREKLELCALLVTPA